MEIDALARPCLRAIKAYKPGKPVEEVQRKRKTKASFIKLASNENPRPPHEKIKKAVIEELMRVNRYPESGSYMLVKEISEFIGVNENEVFVGNGSNEIIDLLVRAFVHPEENVVSPTPSFVIYDLVCKIAGLKRLAVPCRDYRVDLESMQRTVTEETKMIFICNPNNPTATYVTGSEVQSFLEAVPEDILVVIDEAYFEYVRARDYPDSLSLRRDRKTLVILRTFSKFYSLAGIRVGYAIADEKVVEALHKVRQPFNVNRIAQAAARAALRCREDLAGFVEEALLEREKMRESILALGCECPPSQTNFLFVVPPKFPGNLCERMLDRGIIIRDMAPFGAEENVFRVTVGTPEENRKFLEALEKVLKG